MLQLRHAGLKLFACDRRDRRLERASEPSPFPAFRIDVQKDDDCAAWIQRVLCIRPHDCPMHATPFTIARVHAHRHIQREDDLHGVMRMYWKYRGCPGDCDPATLPKVCTRIPSDFVATACHSGNRSRFAEGCIGKLPGLRTTTAHQHVRPSDPHQYLIRNPGIRNVVSSPHLGVTLVDRE